MDLIARNFQKVEHLQQCLVRSGPRLFRCSGGDGLAWGFAFLDLPQVLVPKKLCNEKIIQNWMQMGKIMLITGGILGKLFGSFASTNFIPCDNDQKWSMISLK
jgi:hypothetical protein